MKKQSLILILVAAAINFISCTKNEEDTCTRENFTVPFDRLVKETISTATPLDLIADRTTEFTYNIHNLLSQTRNYKKQGSTYQTNYENTYDCNNNISTTDDYQHSYNSENKLTEIKDRLTDGKIDLVYNENAVELSGTISKNLGGRFSFRSGDFSGTSFELNANNLVTKIIRKDNYSVLEYDVNGNLILAKDFNLNDELVNAYELTYDQNPNPFYGQLQSIYLFAVASVFEVSVREAMIYTLDSANFEITFPYFPNNLIKITEIVSESPGSVYSERKFTYDDENYPISFKYYYINSEIHVSDVEIVYQNN